MTIHNGTLYLGTRHDASNIAYIYRIKLVTEVEIDIKPGSCPNPINYKSKGKIPVAILSSFTFGAPGEVDRASLTFGQSGDEESLAFCNPSPQDVDGDTLPDLMCHFYTEDTGFECGDTEGVLRGQTVAGVPGGGMSGLKRNGATSRPTVKMSRSANSGTRMRSR